VLEAGDRVPDVQVWTAPCEEARPLNEVLLWLGIPEVAAILVSQKGGQSAS